MPSATTPNPRPPYPVIDLPYRVYPNADPAYPEHCQAFSYFDEAGNAVLVERADPQSRDELAERRDARDARRAARDAAVNARNEERREERDGR